jgi:hypothetical protein
MATNPNKSSMDNSSSSNMNSKSGSSSHLSSAKDSSSLHSESPIKELKSKATDQLEASGLDLNRVKESATQIASDLRSRATKFAGDVSHRAGPYYDDASAWISANRSMVYKVVGVLAAVGVAAFAFSRKDQISQRFNKAS